MRLLQVEAGDNFSLVEYVGRDTPPYAILSHTWGEDNEEVTYQDVAGGIHSTKASDRKRGFRKIRFCRDQTVKDGLKHFWIDTCCIDKSSSAELSEAINSMFSWYQRATKCYVYLSDVSSDASSSKTLDRSRWFTRGWTLQELIAPKSVEFFSFEGEHIGDRNTLIHEIALITGISLSALQGCPLSELKVSERISWSDRRQTKREEDAAYSMLGIFGVHMGLLYGEGRKSAFARLMRKIHKAAKETTSTVPNGSIETSSSSLPPGISRFAEIHRRTLEALRFPQMQDRRYQVHEAYGETYQWISSSDQWSSSSESIPRQRWDNLMKWLSSPTETRRIYWIHGKAGSGKSTMMRFIDENVLRAANMMPWAENKGVLRAQYYFWNPGSGLQKSVDGLLRALLVQIMELKPPLAPLAVHKDYARNFLSWTIQELQRSLYDHVVSMRDTTNVVLLIDGLDELDGSDEVREDLNDLLLRLSALEHVKICVSSRPWYIFLDTFAKAPQLRMEDLTRDDISSYVTAKLHSHARFRFLFQREREWADSLIFSITQKAAGVFLWVRLVVRELLNGLRDGADLHMLQTKLDELPSELNLYFRRMMASIGTRQRFTASALLQIVLLQHEMPLIELSFINEARPDFLRPNENYVPIVDLADREALAFRLDSTNRLLNSHCMGLLESHYYEPAASDNRQNSGQSLRLFRNEVDHAAQEGSNEEGQSVEAIASRSLKYFDARRVSDIVVVFLHRSCVDFLKEPDISDLLHHYTGGIYNAQMFRLHAHTSFFMSLVAAGIFTHHTARLFGSIFIALKDPPPSLIGDLPLYLLKLTEPGLNQMIRSHRRNFILGAPMFSLTTKWWKQECSSLLTLAISQRSNDYVLKYLTKDAVEHKTGRPILDYVLRSSESMPPDEAMLQLVLSNGASPNDQYESTSLWALFLCYLADVFIEIGSLETRFLDSFYNALAILIQAGATTRLPQSWLSSEKFYQVFGKGDSRLKACLSPEELFTHRWPNAIPVTRYVELGSDPMYAVSDLLESFHPGYGSSFDRLKALLEEQDAMRQDG